MSRPRPVQLLLLICFLCSGPRAESYDGDVPAPFCNVPVATATNADYRHAPKDLRRMQTQLTRGKIKSQLCYAGRASATDRTLDWSLLVYPPDAAQARRLVETAKQKGWHVKPDYTTPPPVVP